MKKTDNESKTDPSKPETRTVLTSRRPGTRGTARDDDGEETNAKDGKHAAVLFALCLSSFYSPAAEGSSPCFCSSHVFSK